MSFTNITLIGANGTLGPFVLSALLDAKLTVTVLSRHGSQSTYPSTVAVKYISNDPSVSELVPVLQGQDVLITTFGGTNADLQITLADACVRAGVKRFMPADFGSCDSSSQLALDLMPLYVAKKKVREHLDSLARNDQLTWTSIVCGHFFDFGLKSGLLLFDTKAHHATIIDGGDIPFSATTLPRTGLAVVKTLQHPAATQNKMIYIQSFRITQNQLLSTLENLTTDKWTTSTTTSKHFIQQNKSRLDATADTDYDARENLVSVVGIIDADWTQKQTFANPTLGLQDEDLTTVVSQTLTS